MNFPSFGDKSVDQIRDDRVNWAFDAAGIFGNEGLFTGGNMNDVTTQRLEGLLGSSGEPLGFVFSDAGGAFSGSITMLGSTFGGTTDERGSGTV